MTLITVLLLVLLLIFCCAACGNQDEYVENVQPPAFMVDGQIYFCFSERANLNDGQAVDIIGYLTSAVTENLLPSENEQVNVEAWVGLPYAVVNEQMMLFVDGEWCLCKLYEEK